MGLALRGRRLSTERAPTPGAVPGRVYIKTVLDGARARARLPQAEAYPALRGLPGGDTGSVLRSTILWDFTLSKSH